MAWVKSSDTAALHPKVLRVVDHPAFDDRLLNEVFGFVLRCATMSGQHSTDYVVTRGTAVLMAGSSRFQVITEVAVFCGLMEVSAEGDFTIVQDAEFIHLRLKEEIEWEQQRRKDGANPSLIVPVRLRDGDGCRWCGRIVDWGVRKAARSGTYDHLVPGQPAELDTYVVACQGCNSSRKDGSTPRGIDCLLPAPTDPYYSLKSIQFLEGNEWRKKNGLAVPPRPRKVITPGDMAPGIVPASETSPTIGATPTSTEERPGTQPVSANSTTGRETDLGRPAGAGTASSDPRTGTQPESATSQLRPDSQSGNATMTPSPAQTPDLRIPAENLQIPQNARVRVQASPVGSGRDGSGPVGSGLVGSGPVGSGLVGSGRVWSGLVGRASTADPDPPDLPSPSAGVRSRSRRSRSRSSRSRR